MSGDHGAHTHDGPPGGVGWIVLDAIVAAVAAMLAALLVEMILTARRTDTDSQIPAPQANPGGQGHPDPRSDNVADA